ncbi:MASE3 domain-containing protein [Neobacillus dielmonensis]|uniref:MASE3 domain-containing protein n=1 Tax=Neobacillus dielmonensis TaxID=1347369 RepID=UPI0005AB5811|nr:MASE3 domain-containing protein [Neobacillus dielmonensis]
MKSSLTEVKFLLYSTIAIVFLMVIHLYQPELNAIYNPENSTGFHTLLESFSIAISATIFFYGFKSYQNTKTSSMLLLSFTFLLVGILDLFHTLSYKGMPYFITNSSVDKATWFWVIARIIQSIMILLILVLPDRTLKKDYRIGVLSLGAILASAIIFMIFYFEKALPLLFIEGQGTTNLKNGFEYFICAIQFASLIVTLYQYYIKKSEFNLTLGLALVFLLLTDLIFTIYQSVFDFYNFSGHIFKVFGFYFILRGFYFLKSVEEQEEPKRTFQNFMSEVPGIVFKAEKHRKEFIFTVCQGELIHHFALEPEEMIGKSFREVFLGNHILVHDYCHLALRLQERIVFDFDFFDKVLLFSIKPMMEEDEKEVIFGTIIDVTGLHDEPAFIHKGKKKVQFTVM